MKFNYSDNLGWHINNGKDLFVFGNRDSDITVLQKKYGQLDFRRINQVHGDHFVQSQSSQEPYKADAHWTTEPNIALVVATADCMPILISHPKFICAIHAGWRGVLNQIAFKTVSHLVAKFGSAPLAYAVVGPHILYDSFEVDTDLAKQFVHLAEQLQIRQANIFRSHNINNNKAYINLALIVKTQLIKTGLLEDKIQNIGIDTTLADSLHSYRRDKASAGRNFSFVARLES